MWLGEGSLRVKVSLTVLQAPSLIPLPPCFLANAAIGDYGPIRRVFWKPCELDEEGDQEVGRESGESMQRLQTPLYN